MYLAQSAMCVAHEGVAVLRSWQVTCQINTIICSLCSFLEDRRDSTCRFVCSLLFVRLLDKRLGNLIGGFALSRQVLSIFPKAASILSSMCSLFELASIHVN